MKNNTTYRLSQLETQEALRRLDALERMWVAAGYTTEDLNKTSAFLIFGSYNEAMIQRNGRFSAREWVKQLVKLGIFATC